MLAAAQEGGLQAAVGHGVGAQAVDGLLDVVARGAVMATGTGEDVGEDVIRQGAGVAGEVAPQDEAEGLDAPAVFEAAVQPARLVGGVGHLPLPECEQVALEVFVGQAVGEAGAGTATVESEYEAGGVGGAPVDLRPQVEAAW